MNAAKLSTSPRLQRVLKALREHGEMSTWDIMMTAAVCAVNSCIAELRANGAEISCACRVQPDGQRRYFYELRREPPDDVNSGLKTSGK